MKYILILILIINSYLFATDKENSKQKRIEKQIKIEMEKEKKYAKEQTFYNQANYDFRGSEVNPETVKSTPSIELDELDMNSVYD